MQSSTSDRCMQAGVQERDNLSHLTRSALREPSVRRTFQIEHRCMQAGMCEPDGVACHAHGTLPGAG